MQPKGKIVFLMIWAACFSCLVLAAQPVQLPSLFGEPEAQNEYQKNAVLQHGEDPTAKIRKLIFIKTSVSKKDCFVGESVLVVYQLYTAVSCHSRVTGQVAFGGCSVIEMTSDEPEQTVKEKGVLYRVQLIRRVQLIPLQEGSLLIPPATVNNEVSFSTTENPYVQKTYSADVSGVLYTIRVMALPEPQPAGFNGITGNFSITAKTDDTSQEAGETNRLQVTISGTGNIEAVTEPKINWPKHSEHFDPTDSQHINRLNFPESGDKTFIFPFLITKKGNTRLPEISFTYFNTELKKFETISTQEIPLTVTAGTHKNNTAALVTDDLSNGKYLWFVPAIAAVVVLVWLLANRTQKKATNEKSSIVKTGPAPLPMAEAKPLQPDYKLLLTALNEAEDNAAFFTNAKTLLLSAMQHRLSPKQDDERILINVLQANNKALANEAEKIIATCNQNLYSPVENEAMRSRIIEQVSEVIAQLEIA